uniref:ILEI/PANDER domain-containing protein n=1 Tax=Myripristis murdjan TaxID=586833 RepID=A0A667ZGX6_9TELE
KPLNNAGSGVNVVVVHGKCQHHLYDESLIDFLWSIEQGSAVLMASYDDPATNDEARDLIGELGSSAVHSLSFRDNWVFAGGKSARTNYEKHLKYNKLNNKHDGWPEMIELEGCIPKYQD